MSDYIFQIIPHLRFVDAIDIFILSMGIYWILTLVKGTKALSMMVALGVGLVAVWLSSIPRFELYATHWVLKLFYGNLPVIVIVLFQHEIRRALMQIGRRSFFSKFTSYVQGHVIEEVVKASLALASKKIGALIVIERAADLTDHLETGIPIDAAVSKELILSIFMPNSPIHDGALIIQKDRIAKAGSFLPLTMDPRIGENIGTRHRAAIGLTEDVDAAVIVVSEETGNISVVMGGRITKNLDSGSERNLLQSYLMPQKRGKADGKKSTEENSPI
jgi:uncharacterized protein (TIGR00159 family)